MAKQMYRQSTNVWQLFYVATHVPLQPSKSVGVMAQVSFVAQICLILPIGEAGFALFGVFDGHGGKQAATYASKHMAASVSAALLEVDLTDQSALVRSHTLL